MIYYQEVVDTIKDLIKKWELIAGGKGSDKGIQNIPLCQIFLRGNCINCPIFQKTSREACKNTPYDNWLGHHDEYHHFSSPRRVRCEKCHKLAQEELNFLKNLLKEIEAIKKVLVAM